MTVIRPNSISGVTSITAQGGDINLFRADGTKADIPIVNNITAGVVTATKFVGSGEDLTNLPAGQLTGALPAISGANLTGIDATSIKFGSDVKVQANNSGANLTGILTVTKNADSKTVITGSSVGIGTTTTAGRNAGVGTAVGTMIYNSTENRLQVYTHDNLWANFSPGTQINVSGGTVANNTDRSGYVTHTFNSPGTFNTDGSLEGLEVMVIGGGGGGGKTRYGAGGGAGGIAFRGSQTISSPQAIVIGPGGAGGSSGPNQGSDGTNSTFGTGPTLMTGKGGGGGSTYDASGVPYSGRPGGSGGGGAARGNNPGGPATQPGTTSPGTDYGNAGGSYNIGPGGYAACGGGGAGGAGVSTPAQYVGGGNGGVGVQLSISGTATYYAGGGASSIYNALGPVSGHSGPSNHYGAGGNGGGGTSNNNLNTGTYPGASANINGVANSGGGGAGGHGSSGSGLNNSTDHGGSGGSGKVIVAYPTTQPGGDIVVD